MSYCHFTRSKDDTKEETSKAVGASVYSNSESIALSYASIIESYWRQTESYEQSKDQLHVAEDELANVKEYLNEVLKEAGSMKNKAMK